MLLVIGIEGSVDVKARGCTSISGFSLDEALYCLGRVNNQASQI